MYPFDAILFDIGGVLLTNGWDRGSRALAAARFGLNAEDLEARNLRVMEAWDRGEIDLRQYLAATVFFEPRQFSQDEFYAFMLAQSQPLPDGALAILARLAQANPCLIGALNNEGRETNEFRFARFELRRYFRVAFSSCYMGLRKPEPAIYRRALDILGVPPARVLFIDDREENVAAALAAGIHGLHFTGAAALHAELQTLGVL
jgi:putative hydrolase of the HAD superfamily